MGVANLKGNPSKEELSGELPVMSVIMKRVRRYPAKENQTTIKVMKLWTIWSNKSKI
jgi:hypothetical protein